ncbi:MAG TPA: hypothetical protein DCR45_10745 [Gammaproteobacteria bacterium]|nr:hypothetical protein [Gammaproteobacteria bacterium]
MKKLTLFTGIGLIGWSSLSSAQPGERAQELFNGLDTSGDGNLSFEEFLENGRNPVERLDSDADGLVSLEEFLAGKPEGRRPGRKGKGGGQSDRPMPTAEQIAEMQAKMQERAMAKFVEMDLDGDGLLSALEISEATFLEMDADGNGVLSAEELKPPRRAGRSERGGRRSRPGANSGGQSGLS